MIGLFISLYEFPYYIDAPGGVIDVASRIDIEEAFDVKGSFNMAYVSEYKATLPILIYAKINKDWDIQKKSDILESNETDHDMYIRDRLLLEEANQNAIIYAYRKALKPVNISKTKLYSIYIYEDAKTDLKVGDQIIAIDNINIDNKEDALKEIKKHQEGDIIDIKVLNDGKEELRKAELINLDGSLVIGIQLVELSDYTVEPHIKINYSKSESGPSGGLLTSLSIYNYLTEEDITKGYQIAGTGTIDQDGHVGSIGGVLYKIKGAVKAKIKYFLIPAGSNYEEAMKIKKENNYDIEIIPVETFDEALEFLKQLK